MRTTYKSILENLLVDRAIVAKSAVCCHTESLCARAYREEIWRLIFWRVPLSSWSSPSWPPDLPRTSAPPPSSAPCSASSSCPDFAQEVSSFPPRSLPCPLQREAGCPNGCTRSARQIGGFLLPTYLHSSRSLSLSLSLSLWAGRTRHFSPFFYLPPPPHRQSYFFLDNTVRM